MTDVTLPELTGFETYHGIKVSLVGEDGDNYVALGHHEPRAALAAFNAYAQHTVGLEDLTDGSARHDRAYWQKLLLAVKQCWAVLRETCDEYGSASHEDGCFRCAEIGAEVRAGGWWLEWCVDQDAVSAFPVTTLSL